MSIIRTPERFRYLLIIMLAITVGVTSPMGTMTGWAQIIVDDGDDTDDGDDGDDGDNGDDTNNDNLAGAGIVINAQGVLSMKLNYDRTGQLDRQRRRQAMAKLPSDLAQPSELRKISLNRLEAALERQLAEGNGPTDAMQFLAGLTELQYVFYYPDSQDIVIAGPAEGFVIDPLQRPVGIVSGQAILQLDDLIVALRTFGPNPQPVDSVGVSIDPTAEGLTAMQQFLTQFGQRAVPANTVQIVRALRQSLGHQVITVKGVSPNTHFANVLIEADYRMKLIGIGLEQPPVRIASYIQRARPSNVARNALQRWYFIPDYESVRVSDDGLAAQLVGQGVQLVNADEVVRTDGSRTKSTRADRASQIFVQSFTERYPELARKVPVYGQLRNLVDMLIATAYIQQQDYYGQAAWTMETFGDEQKYAVETYPAAKEVGTAVNAVWKGNVLMTPVGGGVHIDVRRAISGRHVQPDLDGTVSQQREGITLDHLQDGQWWWD